MIATHETGAWTVTHEAEIPGILVEPFQDFEHAIAVGSTTVDGGGVRWVPLDGVGSSDIEETKDGLRLMRGAFSQETDSVLANDFDDSLVSVARVVSESQGVAVGGRALVLVRAELACEGIFHNAAKIITLRDSSPSSARVKKRWLADEARGLGSEAVLMDMIEGRDEIRVSPRNKVAVTDRTTETAPYSVHLHDGVAVKKRVTSQFQRMS